MTGIGVIKFQIYCVNEIHQLCIADRKQEKFGRRSLVFHNVYFHFFEIRTIFSGGQRALNLFNIHWLSARPHY